METCQASHKSRHVTNMRDVTCTRDGTGNLQYWQILMQAEQDKET